MQHGKKVLCYQKDLKNCLPMITDKLLKITAGFMHNKLPWPQLLLIQHIIIMI